MDALGFAMMAGGGWLLYCAWKGKSPLAVFTRTVTTGSITGQPAGTVNA